MSSETYPGLSFDREELAAVMRTTYHELIEFITQSSFQAVYQELARLPREERPGFVVSVFLNPKELAKRGVTIPEGVLIQTSAFGDRRPTLFAVKKLLPEKYHAAWENVNWTFNNDYDDQTISRDSEIAWRAPLPVVLQNALIATGANLESVPPEFGIHPEAFRKDAEKTEGDQPRP